MKSNRPDPNAGLLPHSCVAPAFSVPLVLWPVKGVYLLQRALGSLNECTHVNYSRPECDISQRSPSSDCAS